ncbi:MAG: RHS repeat-associated core domain-containing protein [Ruminococcus sp.]|nr:RHS repeat-associated core domain-containing protein [Ruminococcus sp.]
MNPYRYRGEYQDETTGLYYLRSRYYDSTTGRFITVDGYSGSISDPISLHKYLYANANPIMNSDPTGYFTLADVTTAMTVNNILSSACTSSIIGGLLALIDKISEGCNDPVALCNAYLCGANIGLVSGALFGAASFYIQMGGHAAAAIQLGLGSISVYFGYQSFTGAVDSFEQGNYLQAANRALMGTLSVVGVIYEFAGAYKSMHSNLKSSSSTDINFEKYNYFPENPNNFKPDGLRKIGPFETKNNKMVG